MKRLIGFACLLFCFVFAASADEKGSALLEKIAAQYKSSNGISARFVLDTTAPEQQMNGKIEMAKDKFKITADGISIWYNGKYLWSYDESLQEVNLTEPAAEEILMLNPYLILQTLLHGFDSEILRQTAESATLRLTPKENGEIKTALLVVDLKRMLPAEMGIDHTNGSNLHIRLNDYRTGLNLPISTFVFDAEKYPQIEVIDLR